MNNEIDKFIILKDVTLFSKLPFEVIYAIAHVMEWHDIYENQILFSEGQAATGFYIIADGHVTISKKGKILQRLKKCDFFGEAGILNNEICLSKAISQSKGALLYMTCKHFNDLVMDYPDVLSAIVHHLIASLRQA